MPEPRAEPVIQVTGLVKDYSGLRPLRMQSLTVRPGERVSISGLDATAAEVFVNLLNGAIVPDQGEVRVFGRPTTDIADETAWLAFLDRFGIVTPRAVLLEGQTVLQNLVLPFTLDIDEVPADVLQKTRELSALVHLGDEWLERRVGDAPAAVRMRIHLARAVALGPELLLLEHPTAQIERGHVKAFATTVRDVIGARRLTALAVTQDDAFADVVADRAYRLQGGTGELATTRGWRKWF
jgi:ABC-type transporter Mla maintaining outer membrane lipid asymmetry ATPase subunit MlaF